MVELATRPTIVLIPGGWHPPSSYSNLTARLEHLSYPVVALQNPSLNSATKGLRDDISHVQSTLQTLVAVEGKDVVVVSHSYGGLPAMVAVAGYEKIKRKELGEKGGVMGMLYMVTTALRSGISQIKAKTVDDWEYWPENEAVCRNKSVYSVRTALSGPIPELAHAFLSLRKHTNIYSCSSVRT